MTSFKLSSRFSSYNTKVWVIAFVSAFIAVIIYLPALQNEFINWDDDIYVYENRNIRSLNLTFLKWIFTTFHAHNWHPLTWVSHAIDYSIWGLDPTGHHLTNILFHGMNTFLIVILVFKLMESAKAKKLILYTPEQKKQFWIKASIVSIVTGFLFGVHPIHVESVAWVSERKDVLFAFFFLLSLLSYFKYTSCELQKKKILYYFLCLIFFIFALMSKPMAVTLPFVLIILDFYPIERLHIGSDLKSIRKIIGEKTPFIILSIVSSILTISAQQLLIKEHPLGIRLLVSVKATFSYLVKIIFPIHLAPLYPYPRNISFWSLEYIGSFVIVICITAFCIFLLRKQRVYVSVWAFYIVTLLPVLGIVHVGKQAAADRYMYLPSLSLFIMAGLLVAWAWGETSLKKRYLNARRLLIVITIILTFFVLSLLTLKQIAIWKNSIALLTYELEKFPNFQDAYTIRGITYIEIGNYQKAIKDFNKSIQINPDYASVYHYRGKAYEKLGNYQKAIQDFSRVIELLPHKAEAYNNRGLSYKNLGYYQKAIKDFDSAVKLEPRYFEAYNNRGSIHATTGNYKEAIRDFDMAIELNPKAADVYVNRGMLYLNLGSDLQAIKDFQNAARLSDKQAQHYLRSKGMSW